MIAAVRGQLVEKRPEALLVDVGGVGYELRIPLSTFFELPEPGATVRLRVHTYVREDALHLYGFASEAERAGFALLLGISGVGPRLALAILSGLPVERLVGAVQRRDVAALRGIPGVGPKTAERILVELRGRVEKLAAAAPPELRGELDEEVISALTNLGYSMAQAEKALRKAQSQLGSLEGDAGPPRLEALIREALRVAAG